ncbi:MAG: hypothetical protein GXO32_00545 [Crenarchaeota archaeon]|nr:hypothetical protein [Thermoproteota archaeon]
MYRVRVLDHFGIVDRGLRLYVAVGPYHPINGFIAYLKYVPGSGPWRRSSVTFSRVLSVYSPYAVDEACRGVEKVYDPMLGVEVPIVKLDRVQRVVDPRDAASRLLSTCRDELECVASQLLADLASLGLDPSCIGVTGSIMFGIHGRHSDIDLAIYGERCAEVATEVVPMVLQRVSDGRRRLILENLSAIHGVDPKLVDQFIDLRRGVYRSIEVTVVYTWGDPWDLRDPVRSSACFEGVVEVEPSLGALMYPARLEADVGGERIEVVSYESTLALAMGRGGRFRVRGAMQLLASGAKRLVLGVRECETGVEPI